MMPAGHGRRDGAPRTRTGNMPLMNKLLLGTIKTFGRTYDLGAMALYKAGTSSYMKDMDKVPLILKRGKLRSYHLTEPIKRWLSRYSIT